MPDAWGEKILDQLRQHPEQHRVPVLILTRRDRAVIVYPVREYHVKPLSMAELAHSIRIAVEEGSPEHPHQQKRASKSNT
jgi:DNA-binding response OmpR family regulator